MQESQQNNEYAKDLINQIKDLQEKNFELQKNNLKLKKYDAMTNTLKERNERIFKLEEKLKEATEISRKLKKSFLNKEIQLRSDLEKESLEKSKEQSLKIEELNENIKVLQQTLIRKDKMLDDKQEELMMVYKKMEDISSHIESKNVDSVVKKLSKENSELIADKANKEIIISNLNEKMRKRDETIAQLEAERDDLFKKIVNNKPDNLHTDIKPSQNSGFSDKENSIEIDQMRKYNKSLEIEKERLIKKQEDLIHRLTTMETSNIALTSIIKTKTKFIGIITPYVDEDIPETVQQKAMELKKLEKALLAKINEISEEISVNAPRLSKAMNELR